MPLVRTQILQMLTNAISTQASCPVVLGHADALLDDTTPQWVTVHGGAPVVVTEYQQIVLYSMPVLVRGFVREALVEDAKLTAEALEGECQKAIYRGDRTLEGLAIDVREGASEEEPLDLENADPVHAFELTVEIEYGTVAGDPSTAAAP